MAMMASRPPTGDETGAFPTSYPSSQLDGDRKSESAKAAEDLAAARVEAMMQALSSNNLDEEEGEI